MVADERANGTFTCQPQKSRRRFSLNSEWERSESSGGLDVHHVNIFPRAGRPRFHSAWYLRHFVHRYFCLKEKRKSLPLSAINHELIINQP